MPGNTNDLCCKNTENPDVASQRAGSGVYIDLFFIKPNKYGLDKTQPTKSQSLQWANSNYLPLARSGSKAARALHLLVLGLKKVARSDIKAAQANQLLLFGSQRVVSNQQTPS
jgi:hypothetical protein